MAAVTPGQNSSLPIVSSRLEHSALKPAEPTMVSDKRLGQVTLQINLCAGDVAYAEITVPALVRAHPGVAARLAVVDCCRPQRTRIYNPDQRAPQPGHADQVSRIRKLAQEFRAAGLLDEIVELEPGSPHFATLAARYTQPWMTETHDYGGCAFMPYWAGLEFPRTRFALHYDADMLVYQAPGFDWVTEALRHWEALPQVIAATPRTSPPGWAATPEADAPSCHEGRPFTRVTGGWLNDWFSTRCYLFDRERLAPHLPLMRGRMAWEQRLRRLLDRGYPMGPEGVLHKVLGRQGLRRLNLSDERAWLLHPNSKPPEYLALLPRLAAAVAKGRVPVAQRGHADIIVPAWQEFLSV